MNCLASDICVSGGEPLLRAGVLEFLEYSCSHPYRKKGSTVTLQTNGTLISPSIARTLSKLQIHIWLSVDGPDEQTHDDLRGKGSFALLLAGMQSLNRAGVSFGVALFPTLSNMNLLRQTYDFTSRYGCSNFAVLDILKVGRAANDRCSVTIDILKLYEALHKFYLAYPELYGVVSSPLSKDLTTLRDGKPIACGVGKNFTLHVYADGFAVPCYAMQRGVFGLGFVTERSFPLATLERSDTVRAIRNYVSETLTSRCSDCEAFTICGGGCPAENTESGPTYVMTGASCVTQIQRIRYLKNLLQKYPLYQ